jgi:hypothetical protein
MNYENNALFIIIIYSVLTVLIGFSYGLGLTIDYVGKNCYKTLSISLAILSIILFILSTILNVHLSKNIAFYLFTISFIFDIIILSTVGNKVLCDSENCELVSGTSNFKEVSRSHNSLTAMYWIVFISKIIGGIMNYVIDNKINNN